MILKHFEKNKFGKIEFTEDELKTLLDEVYKSGYQDSQNTSGFWWTNPWVYNTTITTTTTNPQDITFATGTTTFDFSSPSSTLNDNYTTYASTEEHT